ncbi:MAG TPA: DUF2336 domain-containing protein [Pseudolabrys sp.]|jgi:uncharacterized protein (DUF2336 family)|nr:DUF2336 domain-containing protein [Pseudolabrys sp.]
MPRSLASEPEAPEDRRNRNAGEQKGVAAHRSLVDELEAAISQRNIGSRADILRQITDLFVVGAEHFDSEQITLFDDVMSRLVSEIEHSARVTFGETISTIANSPPKVTRTLALDDSIEVAGPVLRRSECLDDETLIAGAKTKGQDHLLAISQRKRLSEGVTDVLVERGDQNVVISTAKNAGARFSEFGYSKLVTRSENDSELALLVWTRPEIPREYLLTLFETASETVRLNFETADRNKAELVREMIKQAADKIQTDLREHSSFASALAYVERLHKSGELNEAQVCRFAELRKFDETAAALSLLADLPVGAIERALVHDTGDQILVIAKSIGFFWKSTKAILLLSGAKSGDYLDSFNKLKPETAKSAIQFYRLRERATKAKPR